MNISLKYWLVCLFLSLSRSALVQSAWVSRGTPARQRFLFHGSTIHRSTKPKLSGELLPQGIVDSQIVYRGGLIEKPAWNGSPAAGFREAKSIQSMYYALSSLAKTETADEQGNPGSSLSLEQDGEPYNEVASTIEDTVIDQIDSSPKEMSDATFRNGSTVARSTDFDQASVVMDPTSFLETNDEISHEVDHFAEAEKEDQGVNLFEGTGYENENAEVIMEDRTEPDVDDIMDNPLDMTEALQGQIEDTGFAEDIQDQSIVPLMETAEVGEGSWDDAGVLMSETNQAEEQKMEDPGPPLGWATDTMDDKGRDELPVTVEEEGDVTITERRSEKVVGCVDETLFELDDVIDETTAVVSQEGSGAITEDFLTNEQSNDAMIESSSEGTELELGAEHIVIQEDNIYAQTETDVTQEAPLQVESAMSSSNQNSDFLHEDEWISQEFLGEIHRKAEASIETNHVSANSIDASNDPPLRTLKRSPLFQRMNMDVSNESAFLRVLRRYAESNQRRSALIEQRRMTKSINGLEDVAALNDLFAKLRSAGIVPKIKMFGKPVQLQDGTMAMGKKRKLCIELEWEMD